MPSWIAKRHTTRNSLTIACTATYGSAVQVSSCKTSLTQATTLARLLRSLPMRCQAHSQARLPMRCLLLGVHLSRPDHRLTAYLCCGAVFSLSFAGFFSNAYEQYYVGSGAGGVFCAQTGTTHSLAMDTSQTYAAFTITQATQALAWAVNVTRNASSVLLPLSAAAPAAAAHGVRASELLSPPVPVLDWSALRLFVDAAAPLSEGAARAWRLLTS